MTNLIRPRHGNASWFPSIFRGALRAAPRAALVFSVALAPLLFAAEPDAPKAPPDTEISPATTKTGERDAVVMDAMKVTTATRSAKAVDHIPGAINLITNQDISQQLLVTQ